MKSLIKFILRFHFFILFIIFEIFAFILLIANNDTKRDTFLSSASVVTGYFHNIYTSYADYFALKEINQQLISENIFLRNQLCTSYKIDTAFFEKLNDTIYQTQYLYKPAFVIKNSTTHRNNYITINKGSAQGVKKDMGVISPFGVVGIVRDVSKSFASVITILNTKLGVSGKLENNDFYGSVYWDGIDYKKAKMDGIPNHINIEKGNRIITSGYSAIFPKGIIIGTVEDYKKSGGSSFYDITVKLNVDFKNLHNVSIIENLLREEQLNLEKGEPND